MLVGRILRGPDAQPAHVMQSHGSQRCAVSVVSPQLWLVFFHSLYSSDLCNLYQTRAPALLSCALCGPRLTTYENKPSSKDTCYREITTGKYSNAVAKVTECYTT